MNISLQAHIEKLADTNEMAVNNVNMYGMGGFFGNSGFDKLKFSVEGTSVDEVSLYLGVEALRESYKSLTAVIIKYF